MTEAKKSSSITLGSESTVVLRRDYAATPIVAKILGAETNEQGDPVRLVLDRIIHKPGEVHLGDWAVAGAVTTVLLAATH